LILSGLERRLKILRRLIREGSDWRCRSTDKGDIEKGLVQLSKSSKKSLEELSRRYNKILEEEKSKRSVLPEKKAFFRLLAEVSTEVEALAKTKLFYGVVIGDTGVIDLAERRRAKALAMFSDPSTREEAILQGLVDREGNVLTRSGDKLPDHILVRDLYIAIEKNGIYKLGKLRLSGKATGLEVPMFTSVSFRANVRGEGSLSGSKYTVFKLEDKSINEIPALLKDVVGIFPLRALESWIEKYREERDRIVAIEGVVRDLSLTPSALTGSRRVVLVEVDGSLETVTCFVPPHIPIKFGEYSQVYMIGVPRIYKRDGSITFNVLGIYVSEDFSREESDIDNPEPF